MENQNKNLNLSEATDEMQQAAATPQGKIYDKPQSLIDTANNTFRELCKTLECEQAKLLNLEEKRRKLQEEMLNLKAEIEQEKQLYQMNLVRTASENLKALSDENTNKFEEQLHFQQLDTCFEEDEDSKAITTRAMSEIKCVEEDKFGKDESSIEEQTIHIKKELQNILEQCVLEKNKSSNEAAVSKQD